MEPSNFDPPLLDPNLVARPHCLIIKYLSRRKLGAENPNEVQHSTGRQRPAFLRLVCFNAGTHEALTEALGFRVCAP